MNDPRFFSMPTSHEGLETINRMRVAYAELAAGLEFFAKTEGGNRELALALTNLEQSSMWAVKALVRKHPPTENKENKDGM